ncbi:sugar nucleotide-binding protein [Halosimplex aquaticum]|uniref:Sugar nucleotide-binding protein n=1 Tax=Halosimplex aquaticum TaxID=3026162 RepID=A0ABD5XVT1_9EURY|nr:sugar nucleotide-binding protein [Halosimplex aquaticum]
MTETVLVVGASGYLGRSVAERLHERGYRVVGTYCSSPAPTASVQFDFWTDDVGPLLEDHGVDTVVYAAANEYGGDVDTGESGVDDPFDARAERFAADCAGRRVVYVSSAAVFDGTGRRYAESDPRSPPDQYGHRLATFEDAFDEHCADSVAVRSSYLFGFSRGRLDHRLARTREHLERDEPIAYFTDMYKSPILVTELAEAIATLAGGEATGVLHAPAPRISVYEFHCEAMRALGYDPGPIERDAIPPEMDVAPDTSLSSDRFESLVGFEPSAVAPALRSQRGGTASE